MIRAGIVALLLAVVLSVGYAVDPVRDLIEASIAGETEFSMGSQFFKRSDT